MPANDLIYGRCSTATITPTPRSDFHVYFWPWNSSGGFQLDSAGISYYKGAGLNLAWNAHDIGGSGAYVEANLRTGATNSVKYWATNAWFADDIDIWYYNNESSYYSADESANAATYIADAANSVAWGKAEWALWKATPFYIGTYGNNMGYSHPRSNNLPWSISMESVLEAQEDNDICGQYSAAEMDWCGPEIYQTNTDQFASVLSWLCDEKARNSVATKLIPFVWVQDSRPAGWLQARLEFAIRQPECNGLILWGDAAPAAAPTYYDNKAWMQDALAFCSEYGVTAGTPW